MNRATAKLEKDISWESRLEDLETRIKAIEDHERHHPCERCKVEKSRRELGAQNAVLRAVQKEKAAKYNAEVASKAEARPRVTVRIGDTDRMANVTEVIIRPGLRIHRGARLPILEREWETILMDDAHLRDRVARGDLAVEALPIEETIRIEAQERRILGEEAWRCT